MYKTILLLALAFASTQTKADCGALVDAKSKVLHAQFRPSDDAASLKALLSDLKKFTKKSGCKDAKSCDAFAAKKGFDASCLAELGVR